MKIQFAKNCKLTEPPSDLSHKQNSMCKYTCTNTPRYMNTKLIQEQRKHPLYSKEYKYNKASLFPYSTFLYLSKNFIHVHGTF